VITATSYHKVGTDPANWYIDFKDSWNYSTGRPDHSNDLGSGTTYYGYASAGYDPSTQLTFTSSVTGNMTVKYVYSVSPIPEPGMMILLGSGLVGIGALVIRRRRRRAECEHPTGEPHERGSGVGPGASDTVRSFIFYAFPLLSYPPYGKSRRWSRLFRNARPATVGRKRPELGAIGPRTRRSSGGSSRGRSFCAPTPCAGLPRRTAAIASVYLFNSLLLLKHPSP